MSTVLQLLDIRGGLAENHAFHVKGASVVSAGRGWIVPAKPKFDPIFGYSISLISVGIT